MKHFATSYWLGWCMVLVVGEVWVWRITQAITVFSDPFASGEAPTFFDAAFSILFFVVYSNGGLAYEALSVAVFDSLIFGVN